MNPRAHNRWALCSLRVLLVGTEVCGMDVQEYLLSPERRPRRKSGIRTNDHTTVSPSVLLNEHALHDFLRQGT